jgi:hypothetical protein
MYEPKQTKFSPSHGPSFLVNLVAIDGHFDTLNSLIYNCKTRANNQRFHWDGTNPKENDEVAPNFVFFAQIFFTKS